MPESTVETSVTEWANLMYLQSLGKKVEDLTGDQAQGTLIHLVLSDGAPASVVQCYLEAPRDEINQELREAWEWDDEDLGECGYCHRGPASCDGCMD